MSPTHYAEKAHGEHRTPAVLHVVTDSFSATTAVAPLAKYLSEKGWRNVIACSGKSYDDAHSFVEYLRSVDLDIRDVDIPRSVRPVLDLCGVAQVWDLIRREQPSLVHTHFAKAGVIGRVAAWLAGVPCIHTVYDYAFVEKSGARRWMYRMIERRSAALARRILFISESERQIGVREGVGDPVRMTTVGCGIDLKLFNPANVSTLQVSTVKDLFSIPNNRLVVGTVARLVPRKGLDLLLKATTSLPVDQIDWHLLIVGGGPLRAYLGELAAKLGVARRVSFTGFIDEVGTMPALLGAMDVFCLPSRREGYGMVFAEAGAMGKPVVAPDIPPVNSIISDGRTGLLVRSEGPIAIAAALKELLLDRSLRARIGKEARSFVRHQCDQRDASSRVLEAYIEVVGLSSSALGVGAGRGAAHRAARQGFDMGELDTSDVPTRPL